MTPHPADRVARHELRRLAQSFGLDVIGGSLRRTSSRFCIGVEHGDYNGTELFGVGTDRFLWLACKPNASGRVRIASANFVDDGLIEFVPGKTPDPSSRELRNGWGRFALGADWVLRRAGFATQQGFDAAIFGNIPGGGMSRSASLTLNLLLTMADANGLAFEGGMQVVDLAQAVENDYVGSPCGVLDQVMIYFARAGMGTHYRPRDRTISYVPLGSTAPDFRLVAMDTGTVRPGLENSTYGVRRAECERILAWVQRRRSVDCLAELADADDLTAELRRESPELADRLQYLQEAGARFPRLLQAWRVGDLVTVGSILRADGLGLRDLYKISGPELESMCDIARTVPGVLGERMLGGGDKGASGAIVLADAERRLRETVAREYPRRHPEQATRWAVHSLGIVDGVAELAPLSRDPDPAAG